ncbi:sugar nucleotide-binding protein [Agrococcus sp. ARC_14]|uniref:sugar nucleotide-binding protein n=1 Tax=Agrococcus sp. ARC_14 TaxID=2919927 RepID=UPI001F07043D|nr:sugar nucleotide-binding protein [Agrococcus sp. ARC_14]MCH1883358.1 sugar nucleotide-binding protein [Agrococcus sp. ARC_14]
MDAQARPHSVLLIGCGQLGTDLGSRLVDEGVRVAALRRDASHLPSSFERIAADLRRPLERPLPEVDAMVITLPPDTAATADPAASFRASLRSLAHALPVVPRRVLFVSSTRVFDGAPGERPIDERDAPVPASERANALREAELLAQDLLDAHIIRPAGIYGPGRESLIRRVVAGTPMQHTRRTNRIHSTDLTRALHAMLHLEAPPRILHAVDQAPAPLGDVVTHIAARLGIAPPPAIEPAVGGGTVLRGTPLTETLGALTHPTYRSGYDELLADRSLAVPASGLPDRPEP